LTALFRTAWNTMKASPSLNRIRRESDVLRALDAALRERLPEGWNARLSPGERVGERIADAVLRLSAPDGTRGVAAVEAKVRVQGRDLKPLLQQARLLTVDLGNDDAERAAPIVAARFLSPRIRAELEERSVNYADATGNFRLVFSSPGLFISDRGADRDPVPDDRGLRSLTGRAAARVVRTLFETQPPVTVRELASRSGTSLATISRVVDLLDRDAAVERDARGAIVGVNRTRLIERWTDDYSFTESNATALFLEPRRLERVLDRLRDAPFRYAVTGSLAARLIAEYAEARLAMVYVEDISEAAERLGLEPVASGGNVLLAEPFDPVVFEDAWERDALRYAAPAQVAADLLTSPGRGPAEGEELLRMLEAQDRD
jgi:hypothetical protein